jgi:hypothetical protein
MTYLRDQARLLLKREGVGAAVVAAVAFLSLLAVAGFAFWDNRATIPFTHLAKERSAPPVIAGEAR